VSSAVWFSVLVEVSRLIAVQQGTLFFWVEIVFRLKFSRLIEVQLICSFGFWSVAVQAVHSDRRVQ
jgi:hypothetical protein